MKPVKPHKRTDTTDLLDQLNIIMYLTGYKNFWVQEVDFSKKFIKFYDYLNTILHVLCISFSVMQFGSLFTQTNLTPKQQTDRNIVDITNPLTHMFSIKYFIYKKETRKMFYYIAVLLKKPHNDPDVERKMIKKLKAYLIAYTISTCMTLGFYGVYSIVQVITEGAPFITVITMWPDVHDRSKLAECARIFIYIFWWIFFSRISVVYFFLLLTLIGLGHQYMNLQSYFYSLQGIFDNEEMSQTEKEEKYEESFKLGVKLHADTIWCTNQCQMICSEMFAAHVVMSVGVLINLLLGIVNSGHDLEEASSHLPTLLITLVIMGYFMWNAGDITVEAAKLPEAMYSSGWENCYGHSTVRVRKLVVIAMTQAQQPIVLTALSVVELSYETYLRIIKTAYSVFSVFY